MAMAFLMVVSVCTTGLGQSPALPDAEPPATGISAVPSPTDSAPSYYAGEGPRQDAARVETGFLETITESLTGDVYAEGTWRPLDFRSFLTEGWLESWAGAPAGREGSTPRHGWLGAFDGVFYRLALTTFGDANNINAPYHGERYTGTTSVFLPFSRRFNLLIDTPFVVSNGTKAPGRGYTSEFGDFTITPRFLLAESIATSQVFALGIRAPTGSKATSNGSMALTPRYEFWTNPGGSWVVRGSSGFFVPLNTAQNPVHTSFTGGLAVGRYLRPHDVPFGDLVFYAATNFSVPVDGTAFSQNLTGVGPDARTHGSSTTLTVGPGTRFHLGNNFFFLNYWDIPVTGPHPFTYNAQFALMKVF